MKLLVFTWMRYVLLLAIAIVLVGPFLWLLSMSLKGSEELFTWPPRLLPQSFNWRNYVLAWQAVPLGSYLINSVLVAIGSVILNVLLAALAAYPLARIAFRGRRLVFMLILSTIMIPEQVIMIPLYDLLLKMGLVNTYAGLILPFAVSAFGVFLLRQAFAAIPRDLEDAAVMDGCSHIKIWWHIMLPLTRPALATLAIFTFVVSWGNFLWPLIILKDPQMYTLPVGLSYMIGTFSANYRFLAAGCVIAIVPVIILFLFMQRYFLAGMMSGSLKN
jgi:putative chitobiose transport system permease protein